ncbi:hypothetical protein BV22DRAFT_1005290 [Leucogyrophana mollusca]|uniref:Uncharacterized protein n=1 Tax=Leucogyrophana mollusca TaxID=85980 RepID=A0ACB8BUE3_9AGAM|nr:hypothetical protein BV22DRAFT_1005290 [Leucogyrophana mollusca]
MDSPSSLVSKQNFVVNTSTFFPVVQADKNHSASLQPVLVTVCFSGTLPNHLVGTDIPIQISVAIAEEYTTFAKPVVEAISWDTCPAEISSCSGDLSQLSVEHDDEPSIYQEDAAIPFLPLHPSFNPSDSTDWSTLALRIQTWLVSTVDTHSQQWSWGRDAFWLAFIAANPSFPNGQWAAWDSHIPLEGVFIEQWVSAPTESDEGDTIPEILESIWKEFCTHAALFYPHPIVSTD